MNRAASLFALCATSLLVGCAVERGDLGEDELGVDDDSVVIDTSDPVARAQYDANVSFASRYRARCSKTSGRPRVLVTGFGRFLDNETNATGQLVSAMVSATYPRTARGGAQSDRFSGGPLLGAAQPPPPRHRGERSPSAR